MVVDVLLFGWTPREDPAAQAAWAHDATRPFDGAPKLTASLIMGWWAPDPEDRDAVREGERLHKLWRERGTSRDGDASGNTSGASKGDRRRPRPTSESEAGATSAAESTAPTKKRKKQQSVKVSCVTLPNPPPPQTTSLHR